MNFEIEPYVAGLQVPRSWVGNLPRAAYIGSSYNSWEGLGIKLAGHRNGTCNSSLL